MIGIRTQSSGLYGQCFNHCARNPLYMYVHIQEHIMTVVRWLIETRYISIDYYHLS